jgi:hypothetical protein
VLASFQQPLAACSEPTFQFDHEGESFLGENVFGVFRNCTPDLETMECRNK